MLDSAFATSSRFVYSFCTSPKIRSRTNFNLYVLGLWSSGLLRTELTNVPDDPVRDQLTKVLEIFKEKCPTNFSLSSSNAGRLLIRGTLDSHIDKLKFVGHSI